MSVRQCQSVRQSVQNEIKITACYDYGVAEWIIDAFLFILLCLWQKQQKISCFFLLDIAKKKKPVQMDCYFMQILDPQLMQIDQLGLPTVTAGRDHCFRTCRPYVRQSPLFKIQQNETKRKQCSLLARLWVWPSGSLMTPVLFSIGSKEVLHLI